MEVYLSQWDILIVDVVKGNKMEEGSEDLLVDELPPAAQGEGAVETPLEVFGLGEGYLGVV